MEKVMRYKLKIVDSVTPLHGFVEALNKYFAETPWEDTFKFGTDGKCFYDETETYTYEFDLDYNSEVGEQIAEVAKKHFGEKFDYIEPESLTRFCVVLNDSTSFADSEDQYEADKYKGKEWGVFAKRSRAWVAFGTEKAMKEKAKALNELAKQPTKLTLTEYLSQEAEVLEKGLQDIDEEAYLQDFHQNIWNKAKDNGWDKDIVNKMLDYFETLENITIPQALRKASNFIYRSEHISNAEKRNKMKDGAINYKHSKNDMPSYGVDLRNNNSGNEDEEGYSDIYMHDMFEQTESLVEDANEKIQTKGYELVDDYYGDEVKLVVDNGYMEGFTLNIEADEDLPKELLEYAYGLMAEIAKEVGLVKMKFGGWTGPVYLNDSEYREINAEPDELIQIIKGFKIGTEFDLKFDFGDVAHCVKEDRKTVLVTEDNYSGEKNWRLELTTGEYGFSEDNGFSEDKEITLILKDSKKVKDEKSLIQAKEGDTVIDTKTNKEGKVVKLGQSGNYDVIYVDFGRGPRKIVPMDDMQVEGRYALKDATPKPFRVLYSDDEDYDVAEEAYFDNKKEAKEFAEGLKNKHIIRIEKLERNKWGGIETGYPIKDSKKKLKDMTADEIIKLINEAGEKGRSWGWLEGKLPQEFFNMYGGNKRKRYEVFPVQQGRNYNSSVHLKKPKNLGGDLDFSWVPEYRELKRQIDELYDTYGGEDYYSFDSNIERLIKSEDSISKRTTLESERTKFSSLVKAIRQLIRNTDFIEIDDYASYKFTEKDFSFDQKDYMRALIKSRQNRDYRESQKRTVISTPEKVEITNKEDKVEPLSPEAEAYIRKVLKEDTDSIREKRQRRSSISWNSPKDILEEWQKKREDLKRLLEKLRTLENKGTITGIRAYAPQKEVRYKRGGHYNSSGEWDRNGNYELTGRMTKTEAVIGGVQQEHQKPLAEAISRAFDSTTVKDLRQALEDALEAVKFLPDDTAKIEKAKQDVVNFLEKQKEELRTRQGKRTKRLPDKAPSYAQMLYLFPQEVNLDSPKERRVLSRYDLTLRGKFYEDDFTNYVVQGTRKDLKRYASDYLDYQLHPDYLYREDEFAGDIEEM